MRDSESSFAAGRGAAAGSDSEGIDDQWGMF